MIHSIILRMSVRKCYGFLITLLDKAKNEATFQASNHVDMAPHQALTQPQYEVVMHHTSMAETDTANYSNTANMPVYEGVGLRDSSNPVYQYVPTKVGDRKGTMHYIYKQVDRCCIHLCANCLVLALLRNYARKQWNQLEIQQSTTTYEAL